MSTPEQPATPPLTRKKIREIRNTGSTPIISAETTSGPVPVAPATPEPAPVAAAPLPRAAEPFVVPDPPVADSAVDLGASPLTRRQARQQERIRTASVPVITPEVAAAYTAAVAPVAPIAAVPVAAATGEQLPTGLHQLFGAPPQQEPEAESVADVAQSEAPDQASELFGKPAEPADDRDDPAAEDAASDRAVVNPLLGVSLLEDDAAHVDLPPSFDDLLSRSSSGSVGTPNALIVAQASSGSIVAPVNATGEVLITGTLNLPEGLGSNGHAPGAADGKEADAVLIDGEIPAHSSPTPIAASAAISTVKNSGEIIKPPAPEKGSKLMISLAITAGVLALALVGVLILAFVTGVF